MKGKEEASERMLTGKELTQLSDTEFKAMVIRKLNELTENYQKLQGNYNELTANSINMKKEIETINKGQEEMKNTISELKTTVQGIKSRLEEAERVPIKRNPKMLTPKHIIIKMAKFTKRES